MAMVSIQVDISGILEQIDKIQDVPDAAERAMQKYINEDVHPAFMKTIETWDHQPKFDRVFKVEGFNIIGECFTTDAVYGYVNDGTSPHPIPPKKGEFLHFQVGFTPKTKPGWIGSKSGGKDKSSEWVHPRFVEKHPGIKEPRLFDETIALDTQKLIVQKFKKEIGLL